jgi:hypothetical protein
MEDLEAILQLQEKYHVSNLTEAEKQAKGFVTMRVTPDLLTALIRSKRAYIAQSENQLAAYAFTSDWDFYRDWPIIVTMEKHLPDFHFKNKPLTTENTFQYGPVCIDEAFRGGDILSQLFTVICLNYAPDYPYAITFINKTNERSLRAHARKTPLEIVGSFDFNDNYYYALACSTNS